MQSRVHPKYKTKYRVRNWASYERALIGRGNITIWLSRAAIASWKPEGTRTRGAPPKYSDLAIETALTLRLLVHLPLRQAEGFLTSLFHLMGLDLRSPDHTTLSRRGQHLNLTLRRVPRRAALHLVIDSTGLSMVGEGEWAAAKHGRRGRRGWKKLHLGVDQAGVIVAQALTDSAVDDASTGIDLIETIASSAADGHGGRGLRHARLLRDSQHPRHDRRRAAGEDSQAVPTQPAVERSRWDDQKDQQDWAPSMEEGGRLSSTGPRRERVLPVQVDSRRSTSKSDSRSASCRIGACVQRAQSNDRAWSTRVVRDRSVTNLRVGALGASFDLRNNARDLR